MSTHRPRLARRLAALGAALLVVACTPAPSPSPSLPTTQPPVATGSPLPAAEVYAGIRRAVEQIRELQPTADVDPVTIDAEQLRTNLETEFDAENKAADLRFSEETLILLGLLPPGTSLRAITLDFQGGQVAGYYSPDKKELYVVSRSGGVGAAEKVTYAHEFTHQLTDQRFDLSKLATDSANDTDRSMARLGLIEGDAVSVQTTWTIQSLTPKELGELLQASLDPEAIAALGRAPAYLRETAMFPYQDGMRFVSTFLSSGGYDAVDAIYAMPPESTEQILHPDKYLAHEHPKTGLLPDGLGGDLGSGWTVAGEDTLGEFVLRLWLTEHGVGDTDALAAAAGWGGDRLALLRGPAGALAILLRTEWDSAADAAEFDVAARLALTKLGPNAAVTHAAGSTKVDIAIGDSFDRLLAALGA